MTFLEKNALEQIKERALDLQYVCHQFERFDPSEMLTEVHEMFETLIKLRSGKFYREFNETEEQPFKTYANDFKIVEVTKQRKSKKRGRIVVEN